MSRRQRPADYEREEAQEWQQEYKSQRENAGGGVWSRGKEREKFTPTLIDIVDSTATTSWRKNRKPSATFTLPPKASSLVEKEVTAESGGRLTLHEAFPQITAISRETDSFINLRVRRSESKDRDEKDQSRERNGKRFANKHKPPQQAQQPPLTLEIWGLRAEEAKAKLVAWIEESLPNPARQGKSKWAKIQRFTPEQQWRMERELLKEAERQEFRREAPEELVPVAMAAFKWPDPNDEPGQALGFNFEALDSIRMDNLCYIDFQRRNSLFKIQGAVPKKVTAALEKVRGTYWQVQARAFEPQSIFVFLPALEAMKKSEVELIEHGFPPDTGFGKDVMPEVSLKLHVHPDPDVAEEVEEVSAFALNRVQGSIFDALTRLRFHVGNVAVRLRYGTFVLIRYRQWKMFPMAEFHSMMFGEGTQVTARVTDEMGNKHLENRLLKRCMKAKGLLTNIEAYETKLRSVYPVFGASILLKHESEESLLRFDIEWRLDGDDNAHLISSNWSQFEAKQKEPLKFLDTSIINLAHSSAWNFEITVSKPVDTSKRPALANFARNVRLDTKKAVMEHPSPNETLITFEIEPGLEIKSIKQTTSYRYRVTGSTLIAEATKFQNFTPWKTGELHQKQLVATEERWSFSAWRTEWMQTFSENTTLKIGESATWNPSLKTFFPPSDPNEDQSYDPDIALRKLLVRLEQLEQVVRGR